LVKYRIPNAGRKADDFGVLVLQANQAGARVCRKEEKPQMSASDTAEKPTLVS
jgi:hypothetical protein